MKADKRMTSAGYPLICYSSVATRYTINPSSYLSAPSFALEGLYVFRRQQAAIFQAWAAEIEK
jgi:hypothetical protein